MRLIIYHYLLLIVLLASVWEASAQTRNQEHFTRFRNMGMEEGLPSNRILDMVQDTLGFVWIATENGLCRYDGITTLTYRHQPDHPLSLPHNYVTSLAIDANNQLYIATHNGIVKLNKANETFIPVGVSGATPISQPVIRKIAIKGTDTLYAETVNGMLNVHHLPSGKTDNYYHKPPEQPYYSYHCLYTDPKGDVWVGGRITGLFRLKQGARQLEEVVMTTHDRSIRQPDVSSFLTDSKGRSWLGSINGFYQLDQRTNILTKKYATSTFSLLEDKQGRIWLGTGYGLVRFSPEKNEFTLFRNHVSDPFSLADDQVNQIMEDKDGNLWIATDHGLSILSPENNTPYHLRHLPGIANSLSHSHVTSLAEEKDSSIWMGTFGGGLNRWYPWRKVMEVYNTEGPEGRKLLSDRVKCLYHDRDGQLWIGHWQGNGFNRIDPSTHQIEKHRINPYNTHSDWYNDFLHDSRGRFWLGVWGYTGLVRYAPDTKKILPPNLTPNSAPYNQTIEHMVFQEDFLWLATNRNQIYRFNTQTETYAHYIPGLHYYLVNPYPKGENTYEGTYPLINSIFDVAVSNPERVAFLTDQGVLYTTQKDHNQALKQLPWSPDATLEKQAKIIAGENDDLFYAVNADQIFQVDLKNQRILPFLSANNPATPLFNQSIKDLALSDNTLQILTNKAIFYYNLIKHEFESAPRYFRLPGNDRLKAMMDTPKRQEQWMASEHGVIVQQADGSIRYTSFKDQYVNGLHAYTSHIACRDHVNTLIWVGTDNGLYEKPDSSKTFRSVEVLQDRQIYALLEKNRTLWVGTDSGLVSLNPDTKELKRYNEPADTRLTSHLVTFTREDQAGNIWVGTSDAGVNKVDGSSLKVTHYPDSRPDSSGFWGHEATCFLQSKDGSIWIAGHGLNRYHPDNNTFSHITSREGLPESGINALIEDDKGLLWLAHDYHLTAFNPTTGQTTVLSTRALNIPDGHQFTSALKHSTGLLMFGSTGGAIILDINRFWETTPNRASHISSFKLAGETHTNYIANEDRLKLDHGQNFFSLLVSPMEYTSTRSRLTYRLKGLDGEWTDVPAGNEIFYTSVPPGRYTFELSNHQNKPTRLHIHIAPPFWKTWWFITFNFLLVAGIIGAFFYQHTKRLIVRNRSLEVEQRLLRSQMNPHFIFNSLNAIQSFIFSNSPMEAGRFLSKFAKLIRLTLQNSREPFIPLRQELEAVRFYMDLQQLRWEGKFRYEIEVKNIDEDRTGIPPMMIQPFVENAIEHGFIGDLSDSLIRIKIEPNKNRIHIIIRDNGIGVLASLKSRHKQSAHESLASKITRERLNTLNSSGKSFSLTIEDCSTIDTKSKGTLVSITTPFKILDKPDKK
ncbi:two-component regulator propeller domain-containing protein [Geofilum rubicundum]|uniref:DNA-binding response regulator/sensor histidine kinase n=1 Tax=Geofilum rubicundum JCM 15548 TaxID=1236989 RepID=A0A0E9LVN9_9BACT|nr:two-component regulator propeller domain-containing protein [Geofilum rubicundum]GAO28915.1 DNA-binding response regulator/sensor histidine kinase [Geofilum rubicundum JCM 15548]